MIRRIACAWLATGLIALAAPVVAGKPAARPPAANPPAPAPAAIEATPAPPPAAAIDPVDEAARLAGANNALGEALFLQLGGKLDRNLLIAPASVAGSLELLAQGVATESQAAMAVALRLDRAGIAPERLGAAHVGLQQALASQSLQFTQANGAWVARGLAVTPEFRQAAGQFHAEVGQLDFRQAAALRTINGFAARATQGKIPRLVPSLPGDTRFVLVNALYFKGSWQTRFDRALTQDKPFRLGQGGTAQRPAMQAKGVFRYLQSEDFAAAALPFADPRFEMVLVLPKEGVVWRQGWVEALESARFRQRGGTIVVPRLTLAWNGDLLEPLGKAGFGEVLTAAPGFTRLSQPAATVSQIGHAAVLQMDEDGAEAAAATAILASRSAETEFSLVIDQPFYVMLRERLTGAVIMLGQVADPAA